MRYYYVQHSLKHKSLGVAVNSAERHYRDSIFVSKVFSSKSEHKEKSDFPMLLKK